MLCIGAAYDAAIPPSDSLGRLPKIRRDCLQPNFFFFSPWTARGNPPDDESRFEAAIRDADVLRSPVQAASRRRRAVAAKYAQTLVHTNRHAVHAYRKIFGTLSQRPSQPVSLPSPFHRSSHRHVTFVSCPMMASHRHWSEDEDGDGG